MLDGEPVRSCLMYAVQADGHRIITVEGLAQPDGRLSILQDSFCEAHGLQCGYCTPGMLIAAQALLNANPRPTEDEIREAIGGNLCRCTGYQQIVEADRSLRRSAWPRERHDARAVASPHGFRYIGAKRRTKEHPRFVTGRGRYAADIALPGMKHVALVASPHASARILSIRTDAARAMPGVHYVLTGEEFCAATDSLMIGVDAPKVTRWALARDARALCRRVGRRRRRGLSRAGRGRRRTGGGRLRAAAARDRPGTGDGAMQRRWSIRRTARTSSCTGTSSGARWRTNSPKRSTSSASARSGAATRRCRSRPSPSRRSGIRARRSSTSGRPSRCRNIPTRPPRRCACPAMRCACTTTSTSAAATASSAGSSTPCWSATWRSKLGIPVRLVEDRLENMRGGDMHGPDRIFDVNVAFDGDGTIRALKIRAHRQCRRLCRPRAVPARQAGQRDLRPLSDRGDRLRADLGADQQDAAGSGARLRPVADELRA